MSNNKPLALGMRVRVTLSLRTNTPWIVGNIYLRARKAGAIGTIHLSVPGSEKVWIVRHTLSEYAVYAESELASEPLNERQ